MLPEKNIKLFCRDKLDKTRKQLLIHLGDTGLYSVAWIICEQFPAPRRKIESRRMKVEKTGNQGQIRLELTKDERTERTDNSEYRLGNVGL